MSTLALALFVVYFGLAFVVRSLTRPSEILRLRLIVEERSMGNYAA